MFYIYLLENKINNKKYVGQTCQNPETRWRNGSGYKNQGVIGKAIDKYGWENFSHIILETVETQEEADEREKYYIVFYDTLACNFNGYNVAGGGHKGNPTAGFSDQQKELYAQKQSEIGKQRFKKNPELKQKMSEISNAYWTEENRQKKSSQQKEYYQKNPDAKQNFIEQGLAWIEKVKTPVVCIETGEEFESLTAAGEWANIYPTNISLYLQGKGRYAGHHPVTKERLHWCYPNEDVNKLKNQIYNIVCIETGDRFETTEAAGKYFHVDPSALCKHLNHPETYKSCGKHPETKQKLHWKRLTTGE